MPSTALLIGYARVSTLDQNPALQVDALTAAGCTRVFVDRASGAKTDRPQLAAALDYVRREDTLCIWRLDRLGRSLPHLIEIANVLTDRGVGRCGWSRTGSAATRAGTARPDPRST